MGAALVNPAVVNRCPWLLAEHFFEPVHGRVWGAILEANARGERADPVTLKRMFDVDPALVDLGGTQYIVRLARSAVPIAQAAEYGKHIHRTARMRELFLVADELRTAAMDPNPSLDPASVVGGARARLDALCNDETTTSVRSAMQVVDEIVAGIHSPRRAWSTRHPDLDEARRRFAGRLCRRHRGPAEGWQVGSAADAGPGHGAQPGADVLPRARDGQGTHRAAHAGRMRRLQLGYVQAPR